MENSLKSIIAREYRKIDAKSPDARQQLYDRLRAALRKKCVDGEGRFNPAEYAKFERPLAEAIRESEKAYEDIDLSDLKPHAIERIYKLSVGLIAGFSVLFAIVDFLTPAFDKYVGAPVSAVYCLVGAAAMATTYFLRKSGLFRENRQAIRNAFVASILLLGFGLTLGVGAFFYPPLGASGVLASIIPGAKTAQDSVLAGLSEKTQKLIDIAERTEGALMKVKQETSADPRKEIANLGATWSDEAFMQAIATGDKRLSGLFFDGGFRMNSYNLVRFIKLFYNPEIAALIIRRKPLVDRQICDADHATMPGMPHNIWVQSEFILADLKPEEKKRFFFSICDAGALRAKYQEKLAELAGRQSPREVAEQAGKVKSCIADFRGKHQSAALANGGARVGDVASKLYREELIRHHARKSDGPLSQAMISALHNDASGMDSRINIWRRNDAAPLKILEWTLDQLCAHIHWIPSRATEAEVERAKALLAAIPG